MEKDYYSVYNQGSCVRVLSKEAVALDNIIIEVFLFLFIPLFMAIICIFSVSTKGDGRNTGGGYRTKRSMLSAKNWNLANKIFGCYSLGIFILEGITLLIEYKLLIPSKILLSGQIFYINIALLFGSSFVGIVVTEVRLKHKK